MTDSQHLTKITPEPNQQSLQKMTHFLTTYGPFILLVTAAVAFTIFFTLMGLTLAPVVAIAGRRNNNVNGVTPLLGMDAEADSFIATIAMPAYAPALLASSAASTTTPESAPQQRTPINVVADAKSPANTTTSTAIATTTMPTTTPANCDTLASALAEQMVNPVGPCVDETGLLNLHCATKAICPERVLTTPGTDLSNLHFSFSAPQGGSVISIKVTNGGLPLNFSNTTWSIPTPLTSSVVTLVFQDAYLPESLWDYTQFTVPVWFERGSVEGAAYRQFTVYPNYYPNYALEAGFTFSKTIVDGLLISGVGITPSINTPNFGTVAFIGTQGDVALSGLFKHVTSAFLSTKGSIRVSDASIGQESYGSYLQWLLISNQWQMDGSCLQSYIPSLHIKASNITGLNTWPQNTLLQECSTPPVINEIIISDSHIFCAKIKSFAPWVDLLLQNTAITCSRWQVCSDDSGAIKLISGSFTLTGSELFDCASSVSSGNSSTVDSRYTTFEVDKTQSGIFEGNYASINFNNVTSAFVSTDEPNYNTIQLLRNVNTGTLSIGSSHFFYTEFNVVNVGKLTLTGPNSGDFVIFNNFSPVCDNGGVVPSWANMSRAQVACGARDVKENTVAAAIEPVTRARVSGTSGTGFFSKRPAQIEAPKHLGADFFSRPPARLEDASNDHRLDIAVSNNG